MNDPLPTDCDPVDDLLGGGFDRGVVTQLYGPSAAGKTNLALAAAVGVAVRGDRALYIDTEGLSGDRFRQIARGALDDPDEDAVEDVASRVLVTEVHDFAEQEEAVRDVAELAPRVELVAVDSATGFYRLERSADDDGETLRRVGRQVTHLLGLARKHDLAIVLTNQVFADPEDDRVRALGGHTLDHWSGVVVRLDRFRGGKRRATLEKHHARPAGESATFRITGRGVTGTERTP